MTDDLAAMKQRFTQMMLGCTALALVAVAFAVAHFAYGVGWALWGFVGFLGLSFGLQIWFVRSVMRTKRGG
jgi:multidrug transporter EmrE-like cation transporter